MPEELFFSKIARKTLAAVKKQAEKSDVLKHSAAAMELASDDSPIDTGPVVPVNCLPLEYILGQNGLPLHRSISIQGPTENNKSSLFWFLARLFLANGGGVVYYDLESKHDGQLAHSYIGNPIAGMSKTPQGRTTVFRCGSPEQFQLLLQRHTHELLSVYEKTGTKRPLLVGIDTLGASVSAKYGEDQRLKGKTETEYTFARTVMGVQATLSSWVSKYLGQLPVLLVLLLQEREDKETGEVRATGGKFAGFTKSAGLRTKRIGYNKTLDENYPILRISQEKMSQNTKRNVPLILPARCRYNAAGFREYYFDWACAMMNLLAAMPASMFNDIMTVAKTSETVFSVQPPKGKKPSALVKKYVGSGLNYADVGWAMLGDTELCAELRRRFHISINPTQAVPYSIPDILQGRMWLSPDDADAWDVPEDQILATHMSYMGSVGSSSVDETDEAAYLGDGDGDAEGGSLA